MECKNLSNYYSIVIKFSEYLLLHEDTSAIGFGPNRAIRLAGQARINYFFLGGGRSDVAFTRLPTFSFNKNFETDVIFMYVQNVAFNFHF